VSVDIRIPRVLRGHTSGQAIVSLDADNVSDLLEKLFAEHPALRNSLVGDSGDVLQYTSLFVNDTEVNEMGGLNAGVVDGDVVTILPSMAGGSLGYLK